MINGALSAPKNCLTSSYQLSSIAFRPEALEDIFNIANFFSVLKFTTILNFLDSGDEQPRKFWNSVDQTISFDENVERASR